MAKFLDTSGLTYLWGKITAALGTKQNTLTPGTNISISNDTISSTDTWRPIRATKDVGGSIVQDLRDKPLTIVGNNISSDISTYTVADYLYINDTQPSDFFDYYSTDLPNKSSSSNSTTWSEFGRFSIAKGYWIITVAIFYPKKAGGGRSVGLVYNTSNAETTTAPGGSTSQTVGSSGADVETNVVLTAIVNVTANGYIHIMGRQNSGGTISGTHYIRARGIKLM